MPSAHAAPESRVRPTSLFCLILGLAPLVLVMAAPVGVAYAQADDPAAVDKVTKLNKKAVDEYENLNFDEARKILKDALDLCSQSGLDKHPITARTHIHLGVVILAGFKQRDLAIKQFKKALEIQPDIKLTKSLANPEIQEAFDEAVAQAGKPEPPEAPPEKPPEPLTHDPVTQGKQGKPVQVQAGVSASLGAKRVILNFKAEGATEFTERDMTEVSPGNWQSEIPFTATAGSKVVYYIDAENDQEETLATKGTEESPFVVALRPAPPVVAKRQPEEEDDDEEPGPRWFIGLGLGSGVGWTTGNGEVNADHKIDPPGFAPSGLGHVAPELGYFVAPGWLLSGQLRFQYITGPTEEKLDPATDPTFECGTDHVCSTAKYALAGFVKITRFFGVSELHPYVSFSAGGGNIRHVAEFPSVGKKCGPNGDQTCVDTVAAGPVLFGPGVGVLYNLSEGFALTLGAVSYVGVPDFTFHVDLNAGLAIEF